MPKLNPERLNPANVVTYVLDKPAMLRFHTHNTWVKKQENKPKKQKRTEKQKKESKKKSNKKYNEKLTKYNCECGGVVRNSQYYIDRHFKSQKHIRFSEINVDKINELD